MAEAPYKFVDRRSSNPYNWGSNLLIQAATQSSDRKQIPNLNYDFHRNITSYGWRMLRSIGNYLFANFDIIQGALLEQAELSVGTFYPQFEGRDKEWGEETAAMLMEHDRIMDISGWPHDGDSFRKNMIVGCRRDGDHATLLTENTDGYPFIQTIENHRIGSWLNETKVADGPYAGLSIVNGVILNEFMTPLAYRVYDDPPNFTTFRDIPAASLILSFFPMYLNQKRGISPMACCAFPFSDVRETRGFEMMAQKIGASIALIEVNERGAAPPGQNFVQRPLTAPTTQTPTGLVTESFDAGLIRYFKAASGGELKSFVNSRPTSDQQSFEASMIRGGFAGLEWPVDFALDPTKCGGAQMRVVLEKVCSTIAKNQALVAKAMRRIDGYRISKFMKLGLLRPNDEWYMWSYQGPAEPTADRKYDSDIDLQEIRAGIGTRQRAAARRGGHWRKVDAQKVVEVDSTLASAEALAKKYGMAIQDVITLLNMPTPNGMTVTETLTPGDPNAAPEDDQPSQGKSGRDKLP